MTKEELFQRLVSNALDFVSRAIDEFQSQPKYSIIDFYTAVELFLKARLLHEHWSQVVSKDPDRQRFESGDFHSVTFQEACTRLNRVVQSPVPDRAIQAFESVRRHRNKMVHFFHEADTSPGSIQKIATEQLTAWHYLNRLLTVQWRHVFEDYSEALARIEKKLAGHRDYLRTKFHDIKAEIEAHAKKGAVFSHCLSCGFEAAEVTEVLENLSDHECWVCRSKLRLLEYECPECELRTPLTEAIEFACPNCDHEQDEAAIIESLNQEVCNPGDGDYALTPANCAECDGMHTVVAYDGHYLCVRCFDVSDSLEQCEWCSEHSNGELSDSFLLGCSACEGQSGWHSGRDD